MRKRILFLFLSFISFSLFSLKFNTGFDFSVYYKSDYVPFVPFDDYSSETEEDDDFIFDATELLEDLDGRDERGIESGDEKKVEIPEAVYFNKDGEIRRFSYDGEQMSARKIIIGTDDDGNLLEQIEIVSSYKSKIKKRIFDEKARLIAVDIFSLGDNSKNLKFVSNKKYFYTSDSNVPFKSSETKTDEITKDKKTVETTYTHNGFVSIREEYLIKVFEEKGTDKNKKEKKLNWKKTLYTYDEEDRILSELNVTWFYKDDEGYKTGKSTKVEKKNIYEYTDVCEKPNYSYYEDGKLRLKRNYEDEKSYYEKTFMDDGFSILSYFEDDIKLYEIVYFNDKEIRRRYFDE